MTGIDTAKIRARAEAATEGPWFTEELDRMYVGNRADGRSSGLWALVYGTADYLAELNREARDRKRADAEFIAAARSDVPALCDEVDRLRAENEQVRGGRVGYFAAAAEAIEQRDAALARVAELDATLHGVNAESEYRRSNLWDALRREEALRAAVDRVRALCDEWDDPWQEDAAPRRAQLVRAALDGVGESSDSETYTVEQIHDAYRKHAHTDDWGVKVFYRDTLISALRGKFDSETAASKCPHLVCSCAMGAQPRCPDRETEDQG